MSNIGPRIFTKKTKTGSAILSKSAAEFLTALDTAFTKRIINCRKLRKKEQKSYNKGRLPKFDKKTSYIRNGKWKIKPVPEFLEKRIVEITGPVDRKMIINALNSGADVFMADFEDSSSPTWQNMLDGQKNLKDAINRTIQFKHPTNNKIYKLNDNTAILFVRPRGLHLDEVHFQTDVGAIPASLFDFGLYFFHNAKKLLKSGCAPCFYLPKLQHSREAKLWNDIFVFAQGYIGIPEDSIKATVLIETLPAVFQMDEILYELRNHSAGLNCGRWDYIFSYIKTLQKHKQFVLPDRDQVTMTAPFMKAYTQLLVKTCHLRGAHAMGGMAAQIPIKNDEEENKAALLKVKLDKTQEAEGGHDGTWVAHPGLISTAREAFSKVTKGSNNQLGIIPNITVEEKQLLNPAEGIVTLEGIRKNIKITIRYIEAWLWGTGCVPLYNLMEDAATAEISRAQVWQWINHDTHDNFGKKVTKKRVKLLVAEQLKQIKSEVGVTRFDAGKFNTASKIFQQIVLDKKFIDFLTLPAYHKLLNETAGMQNE
jgi:malate synthase